MAGYREVRADNAARMIALLLASGQRPLTARWGAREVLGVLPRLPMPLASAGPVGEALVRVDSFEI
jgi:hypothetical protein